MVRLQTLMKKKITYDQKFKLIEEKYLSLLKHTSTKAELERIRTLIISKTGEYEGIVNIKQVKINEQQAQIDKYKGIHKVKMQERETFRDLHHIKIDPHMPIEDDNVSKVPPADQSLVLEYLKLGKDAGGIQAQIESMERELEKIKENLYESDLEKAEAVLKIINENKELLQNKTIAIVNEIDLKFQPYLDLLDTQIRANQSLIFWEQQKSKSTSKQVELKNHLTHSTSVKTTSSETLKKSHEQVAGLIKEISGNKYTDGIVTRVEGQQATGGTSGTGGGTSGIPHCQCHAELGEKKR